MKQLIWVMTRVFMEYEDGGEIDELSSEIFELRQETSPDFNRYEESKKERSYRKTGKKKAGKKKD